MTVGRGWIGLLAASVLIVLSSAPAQARKRTGTLTVRVAGLPSHQRSAVRVTAHGRTRHLKRSRTRVRLRAGRVVIKVGRVLLRRAGGSVKKGAVASSSNPRRSFKLRARKSRRVQIDYDTIINPGVRRLPAGAAVAGAPDNPTGLSLPAGSAGSLKVGGVLTSGPTPALPFGLLHRIVAVQPTGAAVNVALEPAEITDAFPKLAYAGDAGPVAQIAASTNIFTAELQASRNCSLGFGTGSILPVFRVANFRPEIDIDATPWGGAIHADVLASMHLTLGFTATSTQVATCELEGNPITAVGVIPIGPALVPIYFTVPLKATARLQANTATVRTWSFKTKLGARMARQGIGLTPRAVYEHGPVKTTSTGTSESTYTLGVSAGAELGLGLPRIANIHAGLGTDLTFTRQETRCDLDWNIGSLSAGGQVGPLKISTPSYTPVKLHLWDGCKGGPQQPPPSSAPTIVSRLEPVTADAKLAPGFSVGESVSSGECHEGSDVGQAYRCFSGHGVYDPCYAIAEPDTGDGVGVVCIRSPFSKELFQIEEATGLGRIEPNGFDEPNGLELANGLECQQAQGAHGATKDGRVIDYGCDDGKTVVLRGLHKDNPTWTADLATYDAQYNATKSGSVAIKEAVLIRHEIPPANRPVTDAGDATVDELSTNARLHHEVDCGADSTRVNVSWEEQVYSSGAPCYESSLIITEWDNNSDLEPGWSCESSDNDSVLCQKDVTLDTTDAPRFFQSTHLRAFAIY